MIYLDSSVLLAGFLAENRRPPAALWNGEETLASSRLAEYEVWNRLHAYGLGAKSAEVVPRTFARLLVIETSREVLARALDPLPGGVRTLDGLHLATLDFLRSGGQPVQLASYDRRMRAAAQAMGVPIYELE